jgi:hypothetical protein
MEKVEASTQGYPQFGLAANSLRIPTRNDASPARLARSVEAWERSNDGASGFQLRSMDRMPLELAQEAAHVYVALRESFPTTAPSYIDLASRPLSRWYDYLLPENQPLALATTYECVAPLRSLTDYRVPPRSVLDQQPFASVEVRKAVSEAESLGVNDVWSTGGIDLSTAFGSRSAYNALLRMRNTPPRRRNPAGTTSAVQHHLNALPYALTHEFGHLVDAELILLGPDAYELVYGEISRAVLDLDRTPTVSQWGKHLINYPTPLSRNGRHAGGTERAKTIRATSGAQVASVLGRYATTNRDELFAEMFVAMFAAQDVALRNRLKRVKAALRDVGLAANRRPNRK